MKCFLSILILITSSVASSGRDVFFLSSQDTLAATFKPKDTFWKYTIAPAAFFGLSAATWHAGEGVRVARNRYVPDFHNEWDNYMQYAPAAAAFALNLSGVKGRNRIERAAVSWGGGMVIMGGLVNSIKYSSRVMRPDETTRNSFPSGHTATAFMNATFLHREYGQVNPLYSILGYSMSTFTGISRSLNNRHWISDILAGAGIGILSAELSYLIVDGFYGNRGDFLASFDARKELEKPSFVSVKIGHSFFMDGLALNGLNSFGEHGMEGSVEGAYFLNKTWGIGGELGFMHIPFRAQALDGLEWDELRADVVNPQIEIQSLGFSSWMVGGYCSAFLGRKFIFQGKILAGSGFGTGGDINIKGRIKATGESAEKTIPLLEYSMRNAWTVGGGVSLTYMIAPALGLSLYADCRYACPMATISISKYYSEMGDRFLDSSRWPISALSGGLRLVSFF
jgi:membrane-associated phospholipid phosphatase